MRSLKAAFTRDGAADNERGSQLYQAKDYQGAYEAFKKAIEANPTNAIFYVNRSAANLQLSKLNDAYRDACRALELNNKLARGYVRKGQVLLKKGEPLLAKKTFHEGMAHAKSASDIELLEEGLTQARTAETFLSMAGVAFAAEADEEPRPLPVVQSAPSVMAQGSGSGGTSEPASPQVTGMPLGTGECDAEEMEVVETSTAEQEGVEGAPLGASSVSLAQAREDVESAPPSGAAEEGSTGHTTVQPQVHWSARLLDSLPKPSTVPIVEGVEEGGRKRGLESMYSPGFLQKHSLNFSSMRDNWLAVVPEWVKGDGEGSGLFGHVNHSEQEAEDGLEAEIIKKRKAMESTDAPKEQGLAVQLGRCIHPIDPQTKELVKLDGFFSYEYENNRLFEHLNSMLMSQQQELVEAIFSLESERKALLHTIPSQASENGSGHAAVQISLVLPQDVTLEANCKTYRSVMAHIGLLTENDDEKWTFESFSGDAHGQLVGNLLTIAEATDYGDTPGEPSEKKEHSVANHSGGEKAEEPEELVQPQRVVHVLRKRTFRMPGLQEPLLVLLVSEPLWKEPYRPVILPPHGGLVAEGDLPSNLVDRFWLKMRHPAASKLSSNLSRFLASFAKNPPASATGKRAKILEFLQEMFAAVQECPLWSGVKEDELTCAREALNKRVISELYNLVFPTVCDPKLDQRTSTLVRKLWFLIPEQLCVPSEDLDESILFAAKKELLAMDLFQSPREKIECLLNCCRIIIFQINSKGQVSSADDFLPLLILVVLQGGAAPRLHANVAFVNAYCERTEELAEAFYYLTMLESAVYFVDHLTPKQVRMPTFLFDKYMRGEMPLYRPMTEDRMLPGDGANPPPRVTAPLTPPPILSSSSDTLTPERDTVQPLDTVDAQQGRACTPEVPSVDSPARDECLRTESVSTARPASHAPPSVTDSLLDEIAEEEDICSDSVRLTFITDRNNMSVEGLQLEALKRDEGALARLVAEYRQLAVLVKDRKSVV